jgi:DNA-directed RNA polymerase sigma subunit (sigma70/sigma32)
MRRVSPVKIADDEGPRRLRHSFSTDMRLPPLRRWTREEEAETHARALAGDKSARDAMVLQSVRLIYHIVKRTVPDPQDHDEYASLATCLVIEKMNGYNPSISRWNTYVKAVVRSAAWRIKDYWAKEGRRTKTISLHGWEAAEHVDSEEIEELRDRVVASRHVLTDREWAVLALGAGWEGEPPMVDEKIRLRLRIGHICEVRNRAIEKLRRAVA